MTITTTEYAFLSKVAYADQTLATCQDMLEPSQQNNWTIIHVQDMLGSGFRAEAFTNSDGKIVVAFSGTNAISDWGSDVQMLFNNSPQQLQDANTFYNYIKQLYPNAEISLTGHSLGGSLAQLVAAANYQDNMDVATFNALGVNTIDMLDLGNGNYISLSMLIDNNYDFSNIQNYYNSTDWVYTLNNVSGKSSLGTTHILDTEGIAVATAHDYWSSFTSGTPISESIWLVDNNSRIEAAQQIYSQINATNLTAGQKFNLFLEALEMLVAMPGFSVISPFSSLLNLLNDANLKFADLFVEARATAPVQIDPLLIDLNGDGIKTTTLANGTYFDHNKDGYAEMSSWVDENDGILVLDKNNDGVINDGGEIFGDQFVLPNNQTATSGFNALKSLDSDNNNIINSNDAEFGKEYRLVA